MLKLFRTARPLPLILVVLVGFALWAQSGLAMLDLPPVASAASGVMPLYALLLYVIPDTGPWSQLLAVVVLLAVAFYALYIGQKHIIIKQRSAMPALMLVLLASSITEVQRLGPALLASVLVLHSIDCLFGIYSSKHPLDGIFRAGLSLSLAVLFYAPAAPLVMLLFVGLVQLRPFLWREWVGALVGLLVPLLGYMLVLFVAGIPLLQGWELFVRCLQSATVLEAPPLPSLWVLLVAFGLPALVALLYLLRHIAVLKMAVRKYHIVNVWLLLLVLLAFLAVPGASWEMVYIVALPLSLLLSELFVGARPTFWLELLFAMPIVGVLVYQLLPLLGWR